MTAKTTLDTPGELKTLADVRMWVRKVNNLAE